MQTEPLGHGIFMWERSERQTNRYGSFFMSTSTYNDDVEVDTRVDITKLKTLVGQRVRIQVRVLESRQSGHCGDSFLQIKPTQPQVQEVVDLGVGLLDLEFQMEDVCVILRPNDNREVLWIDPRKLYHLHDQTVEFYIEETQDEFSPPPDIDTSRTGIQSLGDGYAQIKGLSEQQLRARTRPIIELVEEDCFVVHPPAPFNDANN